MTTPDKPLPVGADGPFIRPAPKALSQLRDVEEFKGPVPEVNGQRLRHFISNRTCGVFDPIEKKKCERRLNANVVYETIFLMDTYGGGQLSWDFSETGQKYFLSCPKHGGGEIPSHWNDNGSYRKVLAP